MVGKFGEVGESSVIRQTLTDQNLNYKWHLMAEIYQFAKFYLPISFSLAIRQTLTPPNIPAIR